MDAHYISHLLLPVIYRELAADQLDPIFEALKLDSKLLQEFQELKTAQTALVPLSIEPAPSSVAFLLAYSRIGME
jgi:hypothetical protein